MTCPECHGEAVDPVRPGPEWPEMCRACFSAIDALDEAYERDAARWHFAPDELSSRRSCSIPGCDAAPHSGGLCCRHEYQHRTHGAARTNTLRVASPSVVAKARARLAARGIAA